MSQKPLPPFGLIVEAYQKDAVRLNFPVYIYIGKDSFKEAKKHASYGCLAMALPHGKSFEDYRWPVNNQRVIIMDQGPSSIIYLKKFCYTLLKTGANPVCLSSPMLPNEEVEIFTNNTMINQG